MKKVIAVAALLAATVLMAVSCGEKCDVCGKNSMGGEEVFGQFVCDNCIEDMNNMLGSF